MFDSNAYFNEDDIPFDQLTLMFLRDNPVKSASPADYVARFVNVKHQMLQAFRDEQACHIADTVW